MGQNISLTLYDTITGNKVVLGTNIALTDDLLLGLPANSGTLITEDSIDALKDNVSSELDTFKKLATAINNDKDFYAKIMAVINGKLDSDGNADTATKLASPVAISLDGDVGGSAIFDGGENITITTTIGANSVTLGSNTTGNYVAGVDVGDGLIVDVTAGEGISPVFSLAAIGTAGTFPKVIVDKYGRVTGGSALAASDIPGLDANILTSGVINPARLPSYVDDVIEVSTVTALPVTGESGKIYITLDNNNIYRWGGSSYIEINTSVGSSDTAIKLATARKITLGGDATGEVLFDGGSDVKLLVVVTDDSHAHWFGNINGKPTTLGGYGITDAVNSVNVQTARNFLASPTGASGAPTFRQIVAGDIPLLNQSTTGNAGTATKLATARALTLSGDGTASISFDGGADATSVLTLKNIGITAGTYTKLTVDAKGRATAGTTLSSTDIPALDASKITTGIIDAARLPSYVDDVIEAASLASFPVTGETSKIYTALDNNKIYRWSGSAYIEISPTAGNADTATKLATARTITLGGDVTGTASFDGGSNITISVAINANSVTLGTDTTGNYVAGVTAGTGIAVTSGSGEGVSPSVALDAIGAGGTAVKVTYDAYGRVTGQGSLATGDVTGLDAALAALKNVPQLSKTAAYTLALTDAGSSIDTTANITVPLNTAVAFPIGTVIGFTNMTATSLSMIPASGVTLILSGTTTTTGNRTLKNYATGCVRKIAVNTWILSGSGIA